jgi:hypothetical protein
MVYIMATLCADALRMPRIYHVGAAGEKPEKKKGGAKAKANAAAAEAEPAAAAAAADDEGLVYIGMRTPQVRRRHNNTPVSLHLSRFSMHDDTICCQDTLGTTTRKA